MTIFEPVLLAIIMGDKKLAITEYVNLAQCTEEFAAGVIDIVIENFKRADEIQRQRVQAKKTARFAECRICEYNPCNINDPQLYDYCPSSMLRQVKQTARKEEKNGRKNTSIGSTTSP
jgi:hypothetical protein